MRPVEARSIDSESGQLVGTVDHDEISEAFRVHFLAVEQ